EFGEVQSERVVGVGHQVGESVGGGAPAFSLIDCLGSGIAYGAGIYRVGDGIGVRAAGPVSIGGEGAGCAAAGVDGVIADINGEGRVEGVVVFVAFGEAIDG